MAPTIGFLFEYLSYGASDIELTSDYEKAMYQHPFWKCDEFPWNGPTCLVVVCYVMKLDNGILFRTIKNLDILASEVIRPKPEVDIQQKKEEFSNVFVNSFMPNVQKFFKVPKLQEVFHKDNSLKENEILASFMDFILQILNSEAHISSTKEHQYEILQKELTFLLSLLGDIPFRCTEVKEVNIILGEIETVANETGSFIYSCIFSPHPVMANMLIESQFALLEMVELLNIKIKDHCIKFSELSSCVISRNYNPTDLIFIVNSLIEDLDNMMNDRVSLVFNDEMKVQIRTLHEELMLSRSFLKDIDISQDNHMDELNDSLVQIRDVAYEAEYLINSYVVGNLPLWYLNLRLPTIIPKIKRVGTRLQEIKTIHDIKVLNIKKNSSVEVSTQAMGTPTNNIVVGFEDERKNIFSDLVGGSKDRKIISIFGMPGLGKTTMANKLYIDRSITDHFDDSAWCVVSQTYQKRKVLIDILMSLSKCKKEKNDILEMEDESLTLEIHQCLKERRYFVVIDDVWSKSVWDDLERFFPDDRNGSRIMLTSRIRDISPTNSIVHSLPLLTEDQCWSLLEKKVFPIEQCPPELQVIGKRISANCSGLPLAVIVIAGVLANLKNEESVWKEVETNLDSYIFDDDTNNCRNILELSYKHLPNHLKMCFLYFAAYPEDAKISVQNLVWLWIAEGFIQRKEDKSPEQLAEEYLFELISRSLVLIGEKRSDGGIKTCNIHDLLRDMCIRKAHEEKFSNSVQDYFPIYDKHHRMFFHPESSASGRPFGLYYRSFSGHLPHPSSRFPQMKLLKVMNLWPNSDSSYELKRVDLLVQLRYLAVDKMPKPLVGNFINLEFLIINSDKIISIPSVILKLVKLRHLHIKSDAEFEEDCYNFRTTNLRSISAIWINNDKDAEILRSSIHLHKLKCICTDEIPFPDLHSLIDLEILYMDFTSCNIDESTKISFPSTIKKLTLTGLNLPWEEISIIGKLPNLQVLKLVYCGSIEDEWKTRNGEFGKLRVLKIMFDDLLTEWTTCSEHFPELQSLVLTECYNLKEIPSEIGEIPTMQTIQLIDCGHELYKSAVQIEEEQRENGNEELHVIITDNEWTKEQLVRECDS